MTTSINATSSTTSTGTSSKTAAGTTDATAMQDRFLKLLVAQMNNQDPMNPMDNAQMTSQMAQINTVNGIQQLNQTLTGIASQFTSMQVLQGSSLVGRSVLTAGSTLTPDSTGTAGGAFDLADQANTVKVEILSSGGQVIDSQDMGALSSGRHSFSWNAANYQGSGSVSFRVTAANGSQAVTASPLTQDIVTSVGSSNGSMSLQLQSGKSVSYADVAAIQ
jgi:flagellar basal-body rod modification protein FlgD